jgi:hypothetical protein
MSRLHISLSRRLSLAVAVTIALMAAGSPRASDIAEFYAAPDGRADADGSRDHPWDLQTALTGSDAVTPGATIWVRGGTYVGGFVSRVAGREGAWTTVRAYPGERAILDSRVYDAVPPRPPLTIEGAYVVVRDLEMTSSNAVRRAGASPAGDLRPAGINVLAAHTRVVNNIIHDAGNCIGSWTNATSSEISGNIAYFCGWDGPDRGHGHGLYVQNGGGTKDISENIFFDQFGNGIQAYTEQGAIDDLRFRRNIVFESGVLSVTTPAGGVDLLVGGRKVAMRPVLDGNFTYRPVGNSNLGYRAGSDGALVINNYLVAGPKGAALTLVAPRDLTLHGNTFVGPLTHSADYPDNTFLEEPHGAWTFVLPNSYDHDRATIVVYNWDGQAMVTAGPPAFLTPGSVYQLHNVQDYFGDVISRIYDGGRIELPMIGRTVATPVGWAAPASTFPLFGVFVVEKTAPAPKP